MPALNGVADLVLRAERHGAGQVLTDDCDVQLGLARPGRRVTQVLGVGIRVDDVQLPSSELLPAADGSVNELL